jgi:hypothetical protein
MDAKQFLAALFGPLNDGEGICIRALQHGGAKVEQRFYGAHAALLQDRDIQKWNAGMSIYFGTALRDLASAEKARKPGCVAITALWADLDAKDFTTPKDPKSVTPEERKAGKLLIGLYLKETLPEALLPSALVDTGGGYQAYWFLKETIRIGLDDDRGYTAETLEGYLAGLQQHIHADPSRKDVTSLMRLPDTANIKYPDRPECRVVRLHPERRFNLSDFDDYRIVASIPVATPSEDAGQDFPELLDAFKKKGLYIVAKGDKHLVVCPWKDAHTISSGQTETALYTPSADNGFAGGFKCQHGHCADKTISDLYKLFIEPSPRLILVGGRVVQPGPAIIEPPDFGLKIHRMTTVKSRPTNWLWANRIPRGALSLLVGDPGDGKTFLTEDWTVRLTLGTRWPTGELIEEPGHVVHLIVEDNLATSVKPRIEAMGSDGKLFDVVSGVQGSDRLLNLTEDLDKLRQLLRYYGTKLCVISPVNAYLPGKSDNYKDPDVRAVLTPIGQLAEELDIAMVGIMHLNKTLQSKILYRIGGSIAFSAVARAIFGVGRDEDDPKLRYLMCIKMNDEEESKTIPFRIAKKPGAGAAMVHWEPESDLTAKEIFAPPAKSGPRGSKREEAQEWLADFLKDGARAHKDVLAAGSEMGYVLSTLYRARKALKVVIDEQRDERGHRGTFWSMPPVSASDGGPRSISLQPETRD